MRDDLDDLLARATADLTDPSDLLEFCSALIRRVRELEAAGDDLSRSAHHGAECQFEAGLCDCGLGTSVMAWWRAKGGGA